MKRRDFLRGMMTVAALAPVSRLAAAAEKNAPSGKVVRRKYRDTELTVPLLGFGMMRLPRKGDGPEIDYATVEKQIARALEAGVNYFDTAYFYHGGRSEKCAGDLLSKYPRDSYFLTSKMPLGMLRRPEDLERIFNDQLRKCKTSYFDFYMFHNVSENTWKRAEKLKVYEFLSKKKAEGKIRRLGFSFHDTPELLQKVVAARKWDFAQIQLNYLDWSLYRSREQYEILTKNNIPVIVMEPLRGGALASLNPEAAKILKTADPGASAASWAFRYIGSLPNVLVILSGMSKMEHLEDNLKTFSSFRPLSDADRKVLDKALAAYRKSLAVPCTDCRYCMPCPAGVEISRIFGLYNQYKISGNRFLFVNNYGAIDEDSRASACVGCGKCLKACPQKIQIPAELRKIGDAYERLVRRRRASLGLCEDEHFA